MNWHRRLPDGLLKTQSRTSIQMGAGQLHRHGDCKSGNCARATGPHKLEGDGGPNRPGPCIMALICIMRRSGRRSTVRRPSGLAFALRVTNSWGPEVPPTGPGIPSGGGRACGSNALSFPLDHQSSSSGAASSGFFRTWNTGTPPSEAQLANGSSGSLGLEVLGWKPRSR